MLAWAVFFFIIAIIAGLLGFTNISGSAMAIGQVLFFIFLIGAAMLFICGLMIAKKVTSRL